MVATGKGNHTGAACRGACNFNGVFHRFGTGCDQQGFLGCIPRGQRVQLFGQINIGPIRHDLKAGVRVLVFLRLCRGDHLGVAVAGVQHTNAADEIDIAVALYVPELCVFGVFRIDRRGRRDTTWDGKVTACNQLRVGFDRYIRIKHVGHDAAFCRFLCSGIARLFFDSARHIQILILKRDLRLKSYYCV